MLNIRNLKIDPESLGKEMLLVDITPAYEYRDGRRVDTITGYRYIVALPSHGLEKVSVKIEGRQSMKKQENYVPVAFEGLEVSAYEMQGRVQISAKAEEIAFVQQTPQTRSQQPQQTPLTTK